MPRKKGSSNKTKLAQKKAIENDTFMLTMLLSTMSILAVALKDYYFQLGNYSITFAIFIFPIIIFVNNYITKKYGFKKSIQSILVASLTIITFMILIKDLVNQPVSLLELFGHFGSYVISMAINLCLYYYIITNFKENVILIYFNYIFSLIIYYLVYLLFLHNLVVTDNLWIQYFISIIIQAVLIIGLVIIDNKIKRGIEKK